MFARSGVLEREEGDERSNVSSGAKKEEGSSGSTMLCGTGNGSETLNMRSTDGVEVGAAEPGLEAAIVAHARMNSFRPGFGRRF
jgi:hypothetical protein